MLRHGNILVNLGLENVVYKRKKVFNIILRVGLMVKLLFEVPDCLKKKCFQESV